VELRGALTLFGFSPEEAIVLAIPRSRGWRGTRAFAFIGGGLVLTPMVGMVPPHAPWAVGALGFGFYFGIRKWREHFTLRAIYGRCPKCGAAVTLKAGTPLKTTLSVSCDSCHHNSQLTVAFPPEGIRPPNPGGSHPPESGGQPAQDVADGGETA